MCKAIEDMRESSRNEGIAISMAKGIEKGIVTGQEEARLSDIRNLMANLSLSLEDAMKALGIPENEWNKYQSKINDICA